MIHFIEGLATGAFVSGWGLVLIRLNAIEKEEQRLAKARRIPEQRGPQTT